MAYQILFGVYAACIALIVTAVFLQRRRLRFAAVLAGAVALWLPLLIQLSTLGVPNPFPPKGDYRLLGAKLNEKDGTLYFLALTMGRDHVPRLYSMPFSKSRAPNAITEFTEYDGSLQVVSVRPGEGGEIEMVYIDYAPVVPEKSEVRRTY